MTGRICSIEGCGRDVSARGWCNLHYRRWHRHGDPATLVRKPHVVQHGTVNEYNNYGCRCDLCRSAAMRYQAEVAAAPCVDCGAPCHGRYRPGSRCRQCADAARRTAEHGTETRYSSGCRCDDCRHAGSTARRNRRHANPEQQRVYDRERRRRLRQATP